MKLIKKWLNLDLSVQIFIALAVGLFLGLFFGESITSIKWIGDVWIRLMQMAVLPYVTASLISGIGSLDASLARIIAFRGFLLLLLFWLIAAVVIVAMPLAFPDWQDSSFLSTETITDHSGFNPVELYIPANPFHSLANSIVPGVVLFSITVGIALIRISNKEAFIDSLKVLTEALAKVMSFMVRMTPIGVLSIVAVAAGTLTLDVMEQLEVYFIVYTVASLILTFIILPLIISILTPFSYGDIIRFSRSAMLTGFVTQNVLVTFPLLISKSKELFEKYRLNSDKTGYAIDVVIPVTFNFPNTGRLLALLFIPFASWMAGSELELSDYPQLITAGIFSLFAKAQIALVFLLDLFRIPHDLFNLYIPSSIINGRFDTMTSVMNLFAFSAIISAGLSGSMDFKMSKLLINSGIMILTLVLSVLITKLSLQTFFEADYNKDKLLLNMKLKTHYEGVDVFTKLPDAGPARSLDQDLLTEIRQRKVLRVGYRTERPPLTFKNNANQLVGLDVQLLNELAADLNVRIEYYPFEWKEFKDNLNHHQLDIVPAVAYDTFNMIDLSLSDPYLDGQLSILVKDHRRHDFASLDRIKQLEKMRIAILGEPVFVEKIANRVRNRLTGIKFDVLPIAHYDEFFHMGDQVDGLVESREIATALALLHPNYTAVVPTASALSFPVSFAVPYGEKAFADFLSQWIAVKKANGYIQDATQYWVYGKGAKPYQPRWSILRDGLNW